MSTNDSEKPPGGGADPNPTCIDGGFGAAGVPLPETIGSYRIIRLLGIGGMGAVYEAEQARPKRIVALKVVKPGLVTPESLRRFELEAEVLGRLQHPGIAQVYEAGTADSGAGPQPYFAMELIRGQPMIHYADAHQLDLPQRLALFVRVCEAVHYAHQQGIIHRDLKPGNILVEDGGQPKILDFGIAKATGSDVQLVTLQTDIGQIIGTLEYMSPEQAAGDPKQVDTRSDVYALGVIGYELLSGKLPLDLNGQALIEAVRVIQQDEPSRLSSLNRRLRGDLETIVGKALEKEKVRRYQSANELASDIKRYLSDEPIAARRPSTWYQVGKFAQRHKTLVGAALVVFAVLVLGIIGTTLAERTAELRLADGLVSQGDALALASRWGEAEAAYWDAYAKFESLHASRSRAEQGLAVANATSPPALLNLTGHTRAIFSVAFSPDGRTGLSGSGDKTLKLWDLSTGNEIRTLRGHNAGVSSVAFSRDGRAALSGSWDKTLKLWDLSTGKEIRTLNGHAGPVHSVAFSPDGRTALSGSEDNTLKLWDLSTGKEIRTLNGHAGPVHSVAFSPDGRTALSGSEDNTLKLWDLSTGKEIRTLSGHTGWVFSVAFSSDGHTALSGSLDNTLKLWDLSTGKEIRTLRGHINAVDSVAFSPDGRIAVSSGWDNAIKAWDLSTGTEIRTLTGHINKVRSVAFSPDGRITLSGGDDNTLKVWAASTGREIRTFIGHTGKVSSVALNRDGHTALSGSHDKTLKLWDLSTGKEIRTLRGHTGGVRSVAFSPDGHMALSGSDDKTLKLWDLSTGKEIHTLRGHTGGVRSVAFSPDGRTALSGSPVTTIKLWEIATGREIRDLTGHTSVCCVAFSPDGHTALSGSEVGTLRLWDLSTGKESRTLSGHYDWVFSVAVSPDGHGALSGNGDTTLDYWDLSTGQEIGILTGHAARVTSVAFSPDGRSALSGSGDKTLKLWDLSTGTEIRSLTGHTGEIWSVAFSPDGRSVLSGSEDKTLKLWDFSRAPAYLAFNAKVPPAQSALQKNRDDPAALAVLGNWYAFRGVNGWAVEMLEKARAGGAVVDPLTLARCYWEISDDLPFMTTLTRQSCLAAAAREFAKALAAVKTDPDRSYLMLCAEAVQRAATQLATTQPNPSVVGLTLKTVAPIKDLNGIEELLRLNAPLRLNDEDKSIAQLRVAVAGDSLAVIGSVVEPKITQDAEPWQGSCIEVFGATPEKPDIGHVVLTPDTADKPALIQRATGPNPSDLRAAPEIQFRTSPVQGGYTFVALIPLPLLAIEPGTPEVLLEFQISTKRGPGGAVVNDTLFGSDEAYLTSEMYGRFHVQRP